MQPLPRPARSTLLVATDVAARGLDIEHVSHVINFDIAARPGDRTSTGSAAPAGPAGPASAMTLVTPRERRLLRWIESAVGQRLEPRRVPTASDVAAKQRERLAAMLGEVIETDELARPMALVDELSAYYDPAQIAAAAISMLLQPEPEETDLPVSAAGAERGMARLFLDVGREDGVRPSDIVGAIANEARIPGKRIGVIEIKDAYSFVEIPEDLVQRVTEALGRTKLRGRDVRVEIARPSDGGPPPARPAEQRPPRPTDRDRDRGPRTRDRERPGGRGRPSRYERG
ncbi:MAG: DbpA RNA binding domain-containing protein [Thermomicrobiales bacterium]